jgi:hypothetical protein
MKKVQTRIFEYFPGANIHPKWGFDLDKVPETHCLYCNKPIGDEEYVLDTGFARFGMMLFIHKKCYEGD